jgi:hypothetical protein
VPLSPLKLLEWVDINAVSEQDTLSSLDWAEGWYSDFLDPPKRLITSITALHGDRNTLLTKGFAALIFLDWNPYTKCPQFQGP